MNSIWSEYFGHVSNFLNSFFNIFTLLYRDQSRELKILNINVAIGALSLKDVPNTFVLERVDFKQRAMIQECKCSCKSFFFKFCC